MDKKAIYKFSTKWLEKFQEKDWNYYEIFESEVFPFECNKLEFEMDCGNKFIETYGEDLLDGNILEINIIKIKDIMILGSGIFSRWRYFNHWSYSRPTEEDIKWFILALTRLVELTRE